MSVARIDGGIIDMRCRPPLVEFRQYFDIARIAEQGGRTGAGPVSPAFVQGSMEMFLEEMEAAGITKAVVQGRNGPERNMGVKFNACFIDNKVISDLQAKYPNTFVGYGGIDVSNTVHNAATETVRCFNDLGLRGIFIEPGRALGCGADDERLFPIYEECLRFGGAVSVMTGPYAGPDIAASNPVYIDRLASRFPALKIICGHGCYPYVNEMVSVAFKHRNVFVSPDMYMFAPGAGAYIDAAKTALKDQMIFGSAYPLRPMGQSVEVTRTFGFDREVLENYLRGNALKLMA
jgi:predicted TIM-barrel fold metal-dependent hydrolase